MSAAARTAGEDQGQGQGLELGQELGQEAGERGKEKGQGQGQDPRTFGCSGCTRGSAAVALSRRVQFITLQQPSNPRRRCESLSCSAVEKADKEVAVICQVTNRCFSRLCQNLGLSPQNQVLSVPPKQTHVLGLGLEPSFDWRQAAPR